MAKRFVCDEDDEMEAFLVNQENKNTAKKTKQDINLIQDFLESEGEARPVEAIPPRELNGHITKFLYSVRRVDGSEYEPTTLTSFVTSLDRYLKKKDYETTVMNGLAFAKTRDMLKARQKFLKKKGKGNKENAAATLTAAQIDDLWNAGQLGAHGPTSIINTMWLYSTIGFGLRGSHEHRQMCWGDVTIHLDDDGHEYLAFRERQSKTRQGDTRDTRQLYPKMWANIENPQKCPVECFKVYQKKRPAQYTNPEDPFYIAPTTKPNFTPDLDQWFKKQPIGENKLNILMKRMSESLPSGAPRLTNHSARKFLVQNLSDNGIPPTDIVQISGHKNIQSVNNYSHLNTANHKHISSLMYAKPPSPKRHKLQSATATSTMTRTTTTTRYSSTQSRSSPGPSASASSTQLQQCVRSTTTEAHNTGTRDTVVSPERPNFDLSFDFDVSSEHEHRPSNNNIRTTIRPVFQGPINGGTPYINFYGHM